jgi:hypothetical protein
MGHGVPLDGGDPDGGGASGAYMFDVGISSTRHIAEFWGLAEPTSKPLARSARVLRPSASDDKRAGAGVKPTSAQSGIGKVINDALRAAGLM